MERELINQDWPNSLRWFLVQNLQSFTPWHFLEKEEEFRSASKAFANEDVKGRDVFVFASRQDCDDFAGLEVIDGIVGENVIYFHPTFNSSSDKKWDIVCEEYEDVFEFVAKTVLPDMKEWASCDDADDID
ncbi:hypothetical protein [Aliikangiella sp. G2MR2-5]|uniref:hypothetical protein n=1 Tax=Aliikangiella sp. G2MR2-5 TaxID=2788943 RepID=UPI0018AA3926|nr:hypothetical protein [Aliikangiella sp. G2MR2-5]